MPVGDPAQNERYHKYKEELEYVKNVFSGAGIRFYRTFAINNKLSSPFLLHVCWSKDYCH